MALNKTQHSVTHIERKVFRFSHKEPEIRKTHLASSQAQKPPDSHFFLSNLKEEYRRRRQKDSRKEWRNEGQINGPTLVTSNIGAQAPRPRSYVIALHLLFPTFRSSSEWEVPLVTTRHKKSKRYKHATRKFWVE